MTVPDMGLTIKDLLTLHTRGISPEVKTYQGEYFGDMVLPRIEDLTDLDQLREFNLESKRHVDNQVEIEFEQLKRNRETKSKSANPDLEN